MKIANLVSKILIFLLVFTSCSNDDGVPTTIIGQWKMIERYESDMPVEVTACDANWITEFSQNGVVNGFPDDLDIELTCPLRISAAVTWSWKGTNQYEIGDDSTKQTYIFYKDGINLVEERPNGTTKIVYEPY